MAIKDKEWIDQASYEQLLNKWRFAAIGDESFQGESGEYYSKVMHEKKNALTHGDQVANSKRVGWDKPQ